MGSNPIPSIVISIDKISNPFFMSNLFHEPWSTLLLLNIQRNNFLLGPSFVKVIDK
ncbi:MAG TPA: hypothetical protein VFT71_07650 [Candidatus Nitrosocosmicus sp.]|nr:hypothetical protein [Candidatus Nitrosocosmicus sp.]